MTVLLDIDPNLVRPGWTPLLIVLALGVVVLLLFRSMRRQFRKVQAANFPQAAAVRSGAAGARPGTARDSARTPRRTEPDGRVEDRPAEVRDPRG